MSRIANPFSIGLNDPTSSSGKPEKSNFDHAVDRLDNSRADVKNNISNGSIILLNNINNLDIIIKYIKSKGYDIVPLEELLTE